MEPQWLIVGISGVTCGGKTTLTNELLQMFPNAKIISQDNYFLPKDSDKHTYIPELNHMNWEILSSLDMDKMYADIKKLTRDKLIGATVDCVLKKVGEFSRTRKTEDAISKNELNLIQNKLAKHKINVLLVEGFSIFNFLPIDNLCHFKFYLTLSYETCHSRRVNRTYDPPDVPGYFEKCVWPEHLQQKQEVEERVKNVVFLPEENVNKCNTVMNHLLVFFETFV